MGFLYPLFLAGAVAAAIPVVLHLLRRDVAPPVTFSAVRLLRSSAVPRAEQRRIRDLLLLAARVLALLLLAAAFARPYVAGSPDGVPGIRIVAIDRSFSMDAGGRFAEALRRARTAVDGGRAGERVAVIAFDDRAEVIAPPGSAADARAALPNIRPGYGGTRYDAMLDKASQVADGASGRLVVITDLQRSGWDARRDRREDPGLQVEVIDVGPPPANVAVTAVRVEPDRVVASIRSDGSRSRTGQVRLEVQGRVAATAEYATSPGTAVDVAIPYSVTAAAAVTVSVDDAQGLAADNRRFVIAGSTPHDALIVASARQSGFYLARALAADSMDRLEPGSRLARDAAALALGDLSGYRAVVLLSTRALDRRARDAVVRFVGSGGGVLVAASPEVDPAIVATMFDLGDQLSGTKEIATPGLLSVTDLRHPIFQPFGALTANLGHARFDRAWRLRSHGWEVVATFTRGTPAVVERAQGNGRMVLFASDLDRRWNDFPVQPSFVPFVVQAVRYVSRAAPASAYLVSDPPEGVPARPGTFEVPRDKRLVAVNIDPRESDPARLAPEAFAAWGKRPGTNVTRSGALQARQVEARQNYWQYGLLLMIGALVAESVVGRA